MVRVGRTGMTTGGASRVSLKEGKFCRFILIPRARVVATAGPLVRVAEDGVSGDRVCGHFGAYVGVGEWWLRQRMPNKVWYIAYCSI
jgi:hypothetical protein